MARRQELYIAAVRCIVGRMTIYKHISLTGEAGNAMRKLAAFATGLSMRRISQSQAIIAAAKVARDHPDEFTSALSAAPTE